MHVGTMSFTYTLAGVRTVAQAMYDAHKNTWLPSEANIATAESQEDTFDGHVAALKALGYELPDKKKAGGTHLYIKTLFDGVNIILIIDWASN